MSTLRFSFSNDRLSLVADKKNSNFLHKSDHRSVAKLTFLVRSFLTDKGSVCAIWRKLLKLKGQITSDDPKNPAIARNEVFHPEEVPEYEKMNY